MTALSARAKALAYSLHAGQVDKLGLPYVEHLEAVVAILLRRWPDAPPEAVAAAWLHDALEDTDAFAGFVRGGFGGACLNIVREVSRPRGYLYGSYIVWLAAYGSSWAIRLKLADLEHNMDPSRRIPGSDIVERRYEPARRVLEAALEGRDG